MIFWRIVDNQLYTVDDVDKLGFEESEALRIPDEYLEKQEFMVMRTCYGNGDWGVISAMPRLLKEKYPDCKVYVPSKKFIKRMFDIDTNVVETIFKNNPYVDSFKDYIVGEIFHDHYRIYDNNNSDISLVEQMLKFWQFDTVSIDTQPEIYWTDEEKKIGDKIIKKYTGDDDYGCLLVSDRFGTQRGKYDEKTLKNETEKITNILKENNLPYFYWTYKPLKDTPFDFINNILDMRYIDLRIQLYIKSKAKVNISNQCGTNHLVVRYSKCYEIQRQFPVGYNFVKGLIYL
tara:strand:- start:4468 stop:5334 length:867 start_codon:yes stop_codon:yes gene_type:complete